MKERTRTLLGIIGRGLFSIGALCGFGAVLGWLANFDKIILMGEWGFGLCFSVWFGIVLVSAFSKKEGVWK